MYERYSHLNSQEYAGSVYRLEHQAEASLRDAQLLATQVRDLRFDTEEETQAYISENIVPFLKSVPSEVRLAASGEGILIPATDLEETENAGEMTVVTKPKPHTQLCLIRL